MKMKCSKRVSSFILCMVLMVAMALGTVGCNGSKDSGAASDSGTEAAADVSRESGELGEGSTQFSLTVTDKDGNETQFEIHTDKETVGEALLELNLIAGDESEYGLFVKTVNGITADYDTDGVYLYYIERHFLRICGLVDPVSVCVDGSLGRGHVSSEAYACENPAGCLYGCMRGTRVPVRNIICPGTGSAVRAEFSGHDCLDRGRAAMGFDSRGEQFLLWYPDFADRIDAAVCGRACGAVMCKVRMELTEDIHFVLT